MVLCSAFLAGYSFIDMGKIKQVYYKCPQQGGHLLSSTQVLFVFFDAVF